MLTINSSAKKVIVFKAIGQNPLRIFPGHNSIDVEKKDDLAPYMMGNDAAQAAYKKHCSVVDPSEVNKEEAERALEKNKKLNKAYKQLAAANKKLLEANTDKKDMQAQINDLTKQIKALTNKKGK